MNVYLSIVISHRHRLCHTWPGKFKMSGFVVIADIGKRGLPTRQKSQAFFPDLWTIFRSRCFSLNKSVWESLTKHNYFEILRMILHNRIDLIGGLHNLDACIVHLKYKLRLESFHGNKRMFSNLSCIARIDRDISFTLLCN